MPRKTRRPVPDPTYREAGVGIAATISIGLLCAVLGSGGTYLALRPALALASQNRLSVAQADREQGNQEEDQGQWAQAIDSYQRAIREGIDNPNIHTDLGIAYFKSSQPQRALDQYSIAQRQDPDHENSLFNEAIAYASLGNTGRAVAVWQNYLQKFPNGQHVAAAKSLIAQVQTHGLTPVPAGKAQ